MLWPDDNLDDAERGRLLEQLIIGPFAKRVGDMSKHSNVGKTFEPTRVGTLLGLAALIAGLGGCGTGLSPDPNRLAPGESIGTLRIENYGQLRVDFIDFWTGVESDGENRLSEPETIPPDGGARVFQVPTGRYSILAEAPAGDKCWEEFSFSGFFVDDSATTLIRVDRDASFMLRGECDAVIAERSTAATYQLVAVSDASYSFATGFAVEDRLIVTNAHVVDGLASVMAESGSVAAAVENETGHEWSIQSMWKHPEYDPEEINSTDVAIIEVDRDMPRFLRIAPLSVMDQLDIFDVLILCGFPFDVTALLDIPEIGRDGQFTPVATCLNGAISSIRPLGNSGAGADSSAFLIQYDIPATRGTSGSAVLSSDGLVVAVNSFGTIDDAGSNRFGIRADAVVELLRLIDIGVVEPVEIAPAVIIPPLASRSMLRSGLWVGTTESSGGIRFHVADGLLVAPEFSYQTDGIICQNGATQCFDCAFPVDGCRIAARWGSLTGLNVGERGLFSIDVDECPDSDAGSITEISGRLSARPEFCSGAFANEVWTAYWVE